MPLTRSRPIHRHSRHEKFAPDSRWTCTAPVLGMFTGSKPRRPARAHSRPVVRSADEPPLVNLTIFRKGEPHVGQG